MGYIQPLQHRERGEGITVGDWLSQITLCFAPLIVHIFVGVPPAVYLHRNIPRWYDKLCFYNPTTIIWRYFVVVDRRIRAKEWKAIDMASTNVRFWATEGWNGSEEMMETTRPFCTRIPETHHIDWVSKSSVETVIVLLQGIQAIVDLVSGANIGSLGTSGGWQVSLGTLFYPFALIGLLRIPAAFWLTDEFSYTNVDSTMSTEYQHRQSMERQDSYPEKPVFTTETLRTTGLLHEAHHRTPYTSYAPNNWRGIITRVLYPLCVLILAGLAMSFVAPYKGSGSAVISTTAFVEALLYSYVLLSTFILMVYYIVNGHSKTTIIPCIQSLWYKIHTCSIFVMMLVLIAIAAVETRKEPCGIYTTYSLTEGGSCQGGNYFFPLLAQEENGNVFIETSGAVAQNTTPITLQAFYGIFMGTTSHNSSATTVLVQSYEGWCSGKSEGEMTVLTTQESVVNGTEWLLPFATAENVTIGTS